MISAARQANNCAGNVAVNVPRSFAGHRRRVSESHHPLAACRVRGPLDRADRGTPPPRRRNRRRPSSTEYPMPTSARRPDHVDEAMLCGCGRPSRLACVTRVSTAHLMSAHPREREVRAWDSWAAAEIGHAAMVEPNGNRMTLAASGQRSRRRGPDCASPDLSISSKTESCFPAATKGARFAQEDRRPERRARRSG